VAGNTVLFATGLPQRQPDELEVRSRKAPEGCCGYIGTTWVCSLHTYKILQVWPRVLSEIEIFCQLATTHLSDQG
jgi:hypothetical protein